MRDVVNAEPSKPSIGTELCESSLVRLPIAVASVCLPVAAVLVSSSAMMDPAVKGFVAPPLAVVLAIFGYVLYVKFFERRQLGEFGMRDYGPELGTGVALGGSLFLSVFIIAALAGGCDLTGAGGLLGVIKLFSQMMFVATLEELLFRGILLRITERAIGSWRSLALSSAVYAFLHIHNENVTILAVLNTAVVGALLGAAYISTRRLWLPIGLHFGWNFAATAVVSFPASGNPGNGLIQATLTGPEWLTGGLYGMEGSALTSALWVAGTIVLLLAASRKGQIQELVKQRQQ